MTRLMGAALLAAGMAGAGFLAVARLEGRVRDLRGMLTGLDAMGRALSASLAPLDEMLAAAAECTRDRPQGFFTLCARELGQNAGAGFGGIWPAALETAPLRLERSDLEALRPLGGVLGRYDGDSQAQALSRTAEHLTQCLAQAEDQRRRLGRVYGTIGVSAGLFLAILLF